WEFTFANLIFALKRVYGAPAKFLDWTRSTSRMKDASLHSSPNETRGGPRRFCATTAFHLVPHRSARFAKRQLHSLPLRTYWVRLAFSTWSAASLYHGFANSLNAIQVVLFTEIT